MPPIRFTHEQGIPGRLGRAGVLSTPHGDIETPAFIVVGTKATVKAVTPEQLTADIGAQAVLGNTYHLYLQPGEAIVAAGGGLGTFMHWDKPTFTDSGGFQVFSLGAGFGTGVGKFGTKEPAQVKRTSGSSVPRQDDTAEGKSTLVAIDDEGVSFKSYLDGSQHRFTPERSMEIQHALGADIMFAFDECPAATAGKDYQRIAMERTHEWAKRSLACHARAARQQGLFGIVQGGRFLDLRKKSAEIIGAMDFDGFGIGGSYTKEDFEEVMPAVSGILPQEKPRHLLGIGEPKDLFIGIEHGIDTFDCVAPTRIARTGIMYTRRGAINIFNSRFRNDFSPIDPETPTYTSQHFTRAYLAHLFRSREMLGATLASIHNLAFIVGLVADIRHSIIEGKFFAFKEDFLRMYCG